MVNPANKKNIEAFPKACMKLSAVPMTSPANVQFTIVVTVIPTSLPSRGNISAQTSHAIGPHDIAKPNIQTTAEIRRIAFGIVAISLASTPIIEKATPEPMSATSITTAPKYKSFFLPHFSTKNIAGIVKITFTIGTVIMAKKPSMFAYPNIVGAQQIIIFIPTSC
eukprot:TRINITY_DN8613_c0_g2_i1.p2 TRINITY_DN8613_c0_g2~~TRINITY_DN8613_c0_g2_i1.p2  ORF type:complete len:166 (+),score=7.55 TRINITY_DN8613_c0_g2_i1:344-841(+)